ncbi:hypothetical protein ACFX16_045670 [Malus domestica]
MPSMQAGLASQKMGCMCKPKRALIWCLVDIDAPAHKLGFCATRCMEIVTATQAVILCGVKHRNTVAKESRCWAEKNSKAQRVGVHRERAKPKWA